LQPPAYKISDDCQDLSINSSFGEKKSFGSLPNNINSVNYPSLYQTTDTLKLIKGAADYSPNAQNKKSKKKCDLGLEVGPTIEPINGNWSGDNQEKVFTGIGKKFSKNSKLIYHGDFVNSKYHGVGVKYRITGGDITAGKLYEGEFQNNEFEGKGVKFFDEEPTAKLLEAGQSDIPSYDGYFKKGMYHGFGTKFSKSGMKIYEGQFENGKYHGKGVLYKENNGEKLYEGEFQYGKYNGQGIKYGQGNYIMYKGDFKNDKFNGIGQKYNKKNALIYEGQFKEDKYDGIGTEFTDLNHVKQTGFWQNGLFIRDKQSPISCQ